MNELTAKLQELYTKCQELEAAKVVVHSLQIQIGRLEFETAINMNESEAYIIDGVIAICHDCEDNKIDFYPVAKPLEDSCERLGMKIYAIDSCVALVDILSSKYSRLEAISIDLIQQDLPDYIPQIGNRLIADVSYNAESVLTMKNFELAPPPGRSTN
jgi:hypothetical protein